VPADNYRRTPNQPMPLDLPTPQFNLDRDKLRALVHYICDRVPNPKQWGATKLNKALFYSDMESFLSLGRPITGETYIKRQFGPVSEHLPSILEELERDRAIAISQATGYGPYSGAPRREFFSLRRPDISDFTPEEISIVDQTVDVICNEFTARGISEYSHDVVWEAAEIGEALPYFTAHARSLGEIDETDVAWARDHLRLIQRRD